VALRDIVVLGDPVLRTVAEEVREIDDSIRALAEDMMQTMMEAPGIGLAAPQVGVSLRLITLDLEEIHGPLVNPRIIRTSKEQESDLEACLSIPEVQGLVRRPSSIVVKGLDLNGRDAVIRAEGLVARCLQHEIDHLDGVVYLDRVSDPKVKVYYPVPDADGEGAVYESELVAVEEVRRRFEARYASKAPA
jgi:peptide deformylase